MHIKQLDLHAVRNLANCRLSFTSGINAFYGYNGSGKTSILEAIYLLGRGRSFRAANLQSVIQFKQEKYVIAAAMADNFSAETGICYRLGTEKNRDNGKTLFNKDGLNCSVSEIAKALPLILLDSSSFGLVDGGPGLRREFIDFAMFHVEHSFLSASQQFKRALLQRNVELKLKIHAQQKRQQVEAWNEVFARAGEHITAARRQFLVEFQPLLHQLLADWCYQGKISFNYKQGWPEDMTLHEAIIDSFALDSMCGFSNRGPQRAELEICIDGVPAKNILSRGQQKVFVCALLLAKAQFLLAKAEINSIFLVDDLNSELDPESFQLVMAKLLAMGGQIFITGIEHDTLLQGVKAVSGVRENFKMFHVEQSGEIVAAVKQVWR